MAFPSRFILAFSFAVPLFVACTKTADPGQFVSQLKTALEQQPELVFQIIEKNPDKFMDSVQKASFEARRVAQQKAAEEAKKQQDEEFKNPKTPNIGEDRAVRGPKNAPVTVVMYSDFQCPYCSRGHQTVEEVRKKYGEKVRFVYKHLPLNFHEMAMPAAKRFEAIAMQSPEKAYKFHDELYANQQNLNSNGEKYMDSLAKQLGVNVAKMKKDMASDAVKKRIDTDMEEAKQFGFSGTPSFLVNGVSLRGAQPIEAFEPLIERSLREVAGSQEGAAQGAGAPAEGAGNPENAPDAKAPTEDTQG